jgi:hypothetical protein
LQPLLEQIVRRDLAIVLRRTQFKMDKVLDWMQSAASV